MNDCKNVLVVEDDESTRESIAGVLEDAGYRVIGAANGQEALELLQSRPHPCVILLDVMMPVMNGTEFRQRQLGDPTLSGIPVVVVSAIDGAAAATLGAKLHLRKPFSAEKLISAVQSIC